MEKTNLFIKQNQHCTVIRIKGRIGSAIILNDKVKALGIVETLRQEAIAARKNTCDKAALLYDDMADALSVAQ